MLTNLKKLREEMGISQQYLADAVSISQQSINKYENHDVQPDIETLKRMADFFNTSIDFVVGYTSTRQKLEPTQTVVSNRQEEKILLLYRCLSDKERNGVIALMEVLAAHANENRFSDESQ